METYLSVKVFWITLAVCATMSGIWIGHLKIKLEKLKNGNTRLTRANQDHIARANTYVSEIADEKRRRRTAEKQHSDLVTYNNQTVRENKRYWNEIIPGLKQEIKKQLATNRRYKTNLITRNAHIKSMDLYYHLRTKAENDAKYPQFIKKKKAKK